MSKPGPFFSPLEERLAGEQASLALDECRVMLEALRLRLRSEANLAQPVHRYQRLATAQLAVEAASEVLSQLGAASEDTGVNPYLTAPDRLRKLP
jgi:hypothetical protein